MLKIDLLATCKKITSTNSVKGTFFALLRTKVTKKRLNDVKIERPEPSHGYLNIALASTLQNLKIMMKPFSILYDN